MNRRLTKVRDRASKSFAGHGANGGVQLDSPTSTTSKNEKQQPDEAFDEGTNEPIEMTSVAVVEQEHEKETRAKSKSKTAVNSDEKEEAGEVEPKTRSKSKSRKTPSAPAEEPSASSRCFKS